MINSSSQMIIGCLNTNKKISLCDKCSKNIDMWDLSSEIYWVENIITKNYTKRPMSYACNGFILDNNYDKTNKGR